MREFKVLSLFNGISCGRLALERAGINVERYVSYEIDQYANQIAKKNYPNDEYLGDVSDADFTQYKGFDLVIGGSPCTHWSIAKNGRETTPEGIGFELFSHFVRAVKESECKYFLYENNFSIHKNIKAAITEALGVEPIMINSSLVSAQNRKRMYWTNIPGVEQPKDLKIKLQDILEDGSTLRDKSKTIRVGGRKSGFGNKHEWDMPNKDRRYSVIEIERLQTLPDNYTDVKSVSENQRHKCIGNGWTIDVIAHILKNIPEYAKNAENCEMIEFPSKIDESENMAS